jgi:hypothetical protein
MTAELQGYRRDRGGQDFVLRLKTVIVAEMVVRCSGRLLVLDWHFPCTSWCTAVVDASRTTERGPYPPSVEAPAPAIGVVWSEDRNDAGGCL